MTHPCTLIEEGTPGFKQCQELAAQLGEGGKEIVEAAAMGTRELVESHAEAAMVRINQAMDVIGEWIETAGEFAVEQTPLLVREIIWYGIAEALFAPLVGVILLSLGIWALLKTFSTAEKWRKQGEAREKALDADSEISTPSYGVDTSMYDITRWVFPIGGGILAFAGTITVISTAFDVVKPWLAPRLYLIEYFRALTQ